MSTISMLYLCNATLSIIEKEEPIVEHNGNILNIMLNMNIFLSMKVLVLYLFVPLVLGILNLYTQLKKFF